jgi:photosystem II stability/assembly factor-like uncharacterized protein
MNFKLVILLTLFSYTIIYSQSNWKWIAPNPPNKMVFSCSIADNKVYFWCEHTSVVKLDTETDTFEVLPTYTTYENCNPGSSSGQGIAFIDSLVGFITDICHGEFRTNDGGYNWVKTAGQGANMIVFGNKLVGWKMVGGGLFKTNNAGTTWVFEAGPVGGWGNGGILSKMFALNDQLWILKRPYYTGVGADVWYTSNWGRNWSRLNTGLISDSLHQVWYYDMKMDTDGVGYIVGSIYKATDSRYEGFILKTTDMGVNWTTTFFPEERFRAVLMMSENEVVVLGNTSGFQNNSIVIQRKTTDAGNSWMQSFPLTNLDNSTFYDVIYSPNNDAIYMFASFGYYKSTDRGDTYQKMTSEYDAAVNQLVFDSKPNDIESQLGIAWLKWNIKPYLITYDGGLTWHKKSLPQSMGYIWMVGIAEEVIYMITEQAKLYKSTDLGETWDLLNLPVYNTGLQALNVYSKDNLVFNAHKNLVSTTDGGNTWILGPKIDNIYLKETAISKPGNVSGIGMYYDSLGQRGCFYNTTDYGYSWHIFDTDNEMNDIKMLDASIGYALGSKKIYKTTDGAKSWKVILTIGGNWSKYSSFAFRDTLNGILDSNEGMKITTDGGENWTTIDYRIPIHVADKMVFNARGDLFMIGGGAMLVLPSEKTNLLENKETVSNKYKSLKLYSSFPNPFNSSTVIRYFIQENAMIVLKIFNVLGEEVDVLVDEYKTAGTFEVTWNANNLPSGIYFYKLQAGEYSAVKKMILIK